MKPVLVLGDTGLLGQALLAKGKELGRAIRGLSRHSPDLACDPLVHGELGRIIEDVQPDVVINAAGLVDVNACERQPDAAWATNARLPALLANACRERNIRLIQISTDHYFCDDERTPHAEDAPVTLVNEYARSKYAGECLALTHPGALVVRTNIVGLRRQPDAPTFAEWLLNALERQIPIELFTDFFTSTLTASQLANALFHLLDMPVTGRLNIASRQGASKFEFAEALATACCLPFTACRPGSVRHLVGAPRATSLVLDVSNSEAILGTLLPDLAAVVHQLGKEYRQNKNKPEST